MIGPAARVTRFSIAVSKSVTLKVKLNAVGRALLRVRHGKVRASLVVLRLAPAPARAVGKRAAATAQAGLAQTTWPGSVPRGAIRLHYCRAGRRWAGSRSTLMS